MTTTTSNMQLVLADVSVTTGPQWAQILNTALGRVDLHDHSSGNGVQITPTGININAALDFNSYDLLDALSVSLSSQAFATTTKTGSLQRIGTNLWWVNSSGVAVQITSGSSVVSTGSGALTASVPSIYPYSVVAGDAQKVLLVDTSAARTLNLPAATTSMFVEIKDYAGSAQTNNISVVPNGTDTIDGANSTFIINENYGARGFISNGVSAWYVI